MRLPCESETTGLHYRERDADGRDGRFSRQRDAERGGQLRGLPSHLEYNQEALKQIQGFPEEARTRFSRPAQSGPRDNEQILKEEWRKRAQGDSSEAKTFRALQTLFQNRPSLLLSGVTVERVQRSFEERMLTEARVYKRQYKRISWT